MMFSKYLYEICNDPHTHNFMLTQVNFEELVSNASISQHYKFVDGSLCYGHLSPNHELM